eukprot:CAMPEP_0176216252 /NCGR_PEP_ID=MMETSP0121_2-20121125/17096_1 /TAXON_ID=160619 /ORGANISM="Kryptoperidinium foliaceum, Strain CCMP 1326" /LENGTH=103 /DNA_ID=CAMNT_0017555375 /DNA_START=130 /DNA_END=441 /DNA_ORIENTATION=-
MGAKCLGATACGRIVAALRRVMPEGNTHGVLQPRPSPRSMTRAPPAPSGPSQGGRWALGLDGQRQGGRMPSQESVARWTLGGVVPHTSPCMLPHSPIPRSHSG